MKFKIGDKVKLIQEKYRTFLDREVFKILLKKYNKQNIAELTKHEMDSFDFMSQGSYFIRSHGKIIKKEGYACGVRFKNGSILYLVESQLEHLVESQLEHIKDNEWEND